MNCCGQKRQQWQQQITQQQVAPVSPELILESPVKLHFRGKNTFMIKGAETGYIYLFTAEEPGLMVDGRDASALLMQDQRFLRQD